MILLTNVLTPWKVLMGLEWSNEHKSNVGDSMATGGIFLARHVKGDDPD